MQVQVYVRVAAPEALNDGWEHIPRLSVSGRNRDGASAIFPHFGTEAADVLYFLQNFLRPFDDLLAGGCDLEEITAGAAEYLESQLFFQQFQLLADTGLGSVKPLGSGRDIQAVLGHRGKIFELLKLHEALYADNENATARAESPGGGSSQYSRSVRRVSSWPAYITVKHSNRSKYSFWSKTSPAIVDSIMETKLSPRLRARIEALETFLNEVTGRFEHIAYASSLGAEAIVLTDMLSRKFPEIEIFTLDTGRLHEETYHLLERLQSRYKRAIKVYYPKAESVEKYVNENGINGFYEDPELRQSCCHIRKVEPFRRAIAGKQAWITGVRRSQSANRAAAEAIEWDGRYGLYKISPLIDWEHEDVWEYIRAFKLPYNKLHDQDYPSIGCAPCTRAIQSGESYRDGRWWWENASHRECGLQPRIRVVA